MALNLLEPTLVPQVGPADVQFLLSWENMTDLFI